MNVIELLTEQHRRVASLFDRCEQTGDPTEKGSVARELVSVLARHSAVEEMDVYPVIEEQVGEPVADRLANEHHELEEALAELERADPADADFEATLRRARALFEEHIAGEEQDVFPRLAAQLDESALDALGGSVMIKWDSAPTHPHPNQPPANKITGPAIGLVDRVRDLLRRGD
jgi:hemerythrin-like domain-containing protein